MLFDYYGHYYTWAHNKFREELETITESEFEETDKVISRSLRDLVIHLIGDSEFYLTPMDQMESKMKELEKLGKKELLSYWRQRDEEFALKANGDYKDKIKIPTGPEAVIEVGKEEFLFALKDHSSFHRGQLLSLLRKYTNKGINTDFYSYLVLKYQEK